ncbi:alpha-fimbriae usher protein [Buttiauxella ferragutiae ATCC 51602]|uniref:Alpha-fimbriae usher protein n=1 Tax=Buttiauxella ferragutiae ATCC 51602 TaxID=1354252 RepID=A0ABX2W7X1_9ENTR|nr:TcfC E-set like domain-containing protein [Buttiauxella ferragutiae]OAT27308.1 alpha-fimbriae usher protein [Buttiauxella ferragutiae ATCC 51602]
MKKYYFILLATFSLNTNAASLKIPAGFEILAQGIQERVDVVIAAKHVGLFDAIVSLDSVKFLEPEKVLAALELPVKPTDRDYQQILNALAAPLARNDILACSYGQQSTGCGFIKTDSVDAIYDNNENSVTLFIKKEWLPASGEQSLYLSPTTTDVVNAFIHQQDMNFLAQEDFSNFYIQGSGALGVSDNSYIGGDWSFSASQNEDDYDNQADLNDLYYRYDIGQRYYTQLGRMDSRMLFNNQGGNFNFSFLPLGAIDGVRIGTTMSYLNREQAGQGTPLTILLTRSARVDAYRNEQLLGSFYLSPGNQNIDNALFPSGSYNVSLRVYESNQLVRTESAPFTKTGGLDDGKAHWFIQGGKISDSDTQDNAAFQAGVRVPLISTLSFTLGTAAVDSAGYIEPGIDYSQDLDAAGTVDLIGRLFHSTEGSQGNSEQINWSANNMPGLNIYRFSSSGDHCSSTQNDSNDYSSQGCYESLNATLTANALAWNFMLGYIRTKNNSDYHTPWEEDKSYEDNLLQQASENNTSKTLQFSASRAFSRSDWIFNTTLGVFRREDDGFNGTDNGVYLSLSVNQSPRADETGNSQSTRLSTDYRDSENQPSQLSYNVAHSWYQDRDKHKELTLEAGGINTDTLDTGISGRLEGQYGNLSSALSDSYDQQDNKHTTAFSGTWSSTVAASREGIHWGAAGFNEPSSAVLVDIEDSAGVDEGIAVDAQVSGNRTAHITQGGAALFPLMGFEPAVVDVSDSSAPLNQGSTTNIVNGAGGRNIMLLPGKLRLRHVQIEHRYGFTGRLLLPLAVTAQPVVGLNSKMLLLSEGGGFTAELTTNAPALYVLSQDTVYQCPLKVKKQRGIIRFVGDVSCQPILREDLPDDVHELLLVKLKSSQAVETASSAQGGKQ